MKDWTAASRGECRKETHKDMSETWLITVAINKTVFLWSSESILTDQVRQEQVVHLLSDPGHSQQAADHWGKVLWRSGGQVTFSSISLASHHSEGRVRMATEWERVTQAVKNSVLAARDPVWGLLSGAAKSDQLIFLSGAQRELPVVIKLPFTAAYLIHSGSL